MEDLHRLLFEKERIGTVLELIKKEGTPDPQNNPDRALLYAHALNQYGDNPQAYRLYTSIPPHPAYEAERLWGLASLLVRMGDLAQAKEHLEEAQKLNPPLWLRLRIYNTQVALYLNEGQLEKARTLIEKAISDSQSEPRLLVRWILEGNYGLLLSQQGRYEEALLSLQRAVKQCIALDAVTSAAHYLINLSVVFENLGDIQEYGHCLERAEPLVRKSGSLYRLVYLRLIQGTFWMRLGRLDRAERLYEETQQLSDELPSLGLKVSFLASLSMLRFRKGDLTEALRLIRHARDLAQEKSLSRHRDECRYHEASFLIRSGAVHEGLEILNQAFHVSKSRSKQGLNVLIALYYAYGHDALKDRLKALSWLKRCLEAAERTRTTSALLTEKEVLVPLLLKLGDELPLTDSLSQLLVLLRHPALIKRFLKRSPEGKTLFLRSLRVHDVRHFHKEFARLRNDPQKEVRHAARLLLQRWSQHTAYRVHTLGPLRVLFEGKLLSNRNWTRPAVKRMFLFFLTNSNRWLETEAILEELWEKAPPERSAKILKTFFYSLRTVLEPWHLADMDYVFFQSQRGAYGFFPGERFWMDYQEFERGIKKAEKDLLARNFKEARKAYREALDLYLGDYLEEFPYEDWLNQKRDYLRELYFRGVMRYATLERDSGNLPEARRVLEEALFKDLSRCDCITLLIQTLAQMKLTQQARDWGQRHIQYMKKELKEKPAPEVVEALGKLG